MKKKMYILLGVVIFISILLFSIFGVFFTDYSYSAVDLFSIYSHPNYRHILGTDNLGRDVFTRLVYGTRVSLIVGVLATVMQIFIGVFMGVVAGYFGKKIDFIVMRIIDILMCFPFFIVAISIASVLGASLKNLLIIISALSWTEVARIVRAQTLYLKKMDFVGVSKCIGFSDRKIIIDNIIPNVLPSIIVAATMSMATSILMEASLSFLGLGVKEPMPSLGNILTSAQNIRALQSFWWTWLPAGITMVLLVLSVNFIGEGLRIHFNPVEEKDDSTVHISTDISLYPGMVTALVGESGSGKTVSAKGILSLNPSNISVGGKILYGGKNILHISKSDREKYRGSKISMIFQEPMKALNPVMSLGKQVEEVYKIHTSMKKKERYYAVIELFKSVMLDDPEIIYKKYPHEISGGQRQRVQIAMAIAMKPKILIADEPTTAIDDSLREGILRLIKKLSIENNIAVLFITHDLKRIKGFADNIVVMKKGEVVEKTTSEKFFTSPRSEYSKILLDSIPDPKKFNGRFLSYKE